MDQFENGYFWENMRDINFLDMFALPSQRAKISFFVDPEKERRIRRPMCFIFNIGKTVPAKLRAAQSHNI